MIQNDSITLLCTRILACAHACMFPNLCVLCARACMFPTCCLLALVLTQGVFLLELISTACKERVCRLCEYVTFQRIRCCCEVLCSMVVGRDTCVHTFPWACLYVCWLSRTLSRHACLCMLVQACTLLGQLVLNEARQLLETCDCKFA